MCLYVDSCLELGQHLDTCPVIPWAENQVMPYLNFWPTELWTSKWVLHAIKFVVICYVTVVYKNNNNSVPSHITESNPVFLKNLQFPPWPVPSFLKVSYIEGSLLSSLLMCSPTHTDFLPFLEVPWMCKYVSNPDFFICPSHFLECSLWKSCVVFSFTSSRSFLKCNFSMRTLLHFRVKLQLLSHLQHSASHFTALLFLYNSYKLQLTLEQQRFELCRWVFFFFLFSKYLLQHCMIWVWLNLLIRNWGYGSPTAKLYTDFWLPGGPASLTPMLFKGQLYSILWWELVYLVYF